ncbi:hypothetical protein ACIBMZ_29325 [Micromonospora sp. NPDC049900]
MTMIEADLNATCLGRLPEEGLCRPGWAAYHHPPIDMIAAKVDISDA